MLVFLSKFPEKKTACIGSRKVIGTNEFPLSGHVFDVDGVINFHIKYEKVQTKKYEIKRSS